MWGVGGEFIFFYLKTILGFVIFVNKTGRTRVKETDKHKVHKAQQRLSRMRKPVNVGHKLKRYLLCGRRRSLKP